jgi:Big-like domain-containing protein
MDGNEYSRREFLRTFAVLSTASLVVGLNAGCSESRSTPALYGPPPPNYTHPEVISIYFIDSQSNRILLQNNQTVPIQVVCHIEFSKSMNTAVPVTISFADSAGNTVPISKSWQNDLTLVVTPVSQLLLNTTYTLSAGSDAEDTFGNKISLTADATASFKTVSV